MRDWMSEWEDRTGQNDYDESDKIRSNIPEKPSNDLYSSGAAGLDYEPVPPPDSGEYEDSFILPYGMSEEDLQVAKDEAEEVEAQLKAGKAYIAAKPKKVDYKQLSIFELLNNDEGEAE